MSRHGKTAFGQELAFVRRYLAAVTFSLLALGSASAGAAVRVDVQPGVVVVNASNATVAEILTALRETGYLHYRTPVDLSRTVSGTYKGTLQRVVSRLLDGYDFTLQVSDNRIEVVIIGLAGAMPTTTQTTTAAAPPWLLSNGPGSSSTAANVAAAIEAANGGAANVAVRSP
jgi:hypothetical protein